MNGLSIFMEGFEPSNQQLQVNIFGIDGRLVHQETISAIDTQTIDITPQNQLSSGAYILTATRENQKISKPFFVK